RHRGSRMSDECQSKKNSRSARIARIVRYARRCLIALAPSQRCDRIMGGARQRRLTVAERRFAERAAELEPLGLQQRFERIYSTNLWSDPETRSGVGSSLDSTRALRAELPKAMRSLSARTLLDVPCGDFSWMQHVDL